MQAAYHRSKYSPGRRTSLPHTLLHIQTCAALHRYADQSFPSSHVYTTGGTRSQALSHFSPDNDANDRFDVMTRLRQKPLVAGLILVALFFITYIRPLGALVLPRQDGRPPLRLADQLPCSRLPGAQDVMVVMTTGATEFQDKIPIHLATTLRCYPNHRIMADFEEIYQGEHVIDVLASVDPELKDSHADFALYRRLRVGGRTVLLASELSGPESHVNSNTGKPENPGWKLDKWKFLPMMNTTWHEQPDMKWYLFVETDNYVFWATLLQYLSSLDHTRSYYLGGQMSIGETLFAHGGAGFAVSHEALRRVFEHYSSHTKGWEDFTDEQWAGDCVLGKAFKDANAPLTDSWPIF